MPFPLAVLGLLLFLCPFLPAREVILRLEHKTEYGSGPSALETLYTPGGLVDRGLYVGQPNVLNRRDRGLISFNADSLLLVADHIKKAQLVFCVDHLEGTDARTVTIQYFLHSLMSLSGSALNDPDVKTAGEVKVAQSDSVSGAHATVSKRLDVTSVVTQLLQAGESILTFRFEDHDAETAVRTSSAPLGVVIAAGSYLPELLVTVEDNKP